MTNRDEPDPGHVGRILAERGFSFVDFTRESHADWGDTGGASLVVSLGSAWSTYWEQVSAPVAAEQGLMADAIGRGIPVLGICFGAQQLSTVLGGTVSRAEVAEIGWHRVEPDGAGGSLEWLYSGPWMQWHYDRFSVPPGAVPLARSASGPQAFRAGRNLAVQFHPEATESVVSRWSQGDGARELDEAGIGVENLLATTRDHQSHAAARCERLVDWFLSDVAQLHLGL